MMRSHPLAPPPPLPELIDDAIAEVLLRLPPDDPACLVRASLVCKLWHRILSEPTFPDRYREFHGTPPLLGFVCDYTYTSGYGGVSDRFFPITTPRIPFRQQPAFGGQALDCRHGRVLVLLDAGTISESSHLAVWDPVTGEHKVLSDPDPAYASGGYSGAVLSAAAGCDHRGCHGGGPFQVVFVSTLSSYDDDEVANNAARAWVYSSETDAWSAPAYVQIHFDGYRAMVERSRAAIVGDQIYFLLNPGAGILKYDLGKQCLTVVGSPYEFIQHGILMTMEDGSLGLVGINDDESTTLYMWRATKGNNPNGSMGWVQDRVFLLDKLLDPIIQTTEDTYSEVIRVVGFAEGVDILLLGECEDGRGFMFELKSGRIRELSKPDEYYCYCYAVFFPYLSFYIPDFASHN